METINMKCRPFVQDRIIFWCPGCNTHHCVNKGWSFNGDFERPTFSPSILVRGSVPMTEEEMDRAYNGESIQLKPLICHSFVRDGNIEYLSDCTHELSGKTIPMEDIED